MLYDIPMLINKEICITFNLLVFTLSILKMETGGLRQLQRMVKKCGMEWYVSSKTKELISAVQA